MIISKHNFLLKPETTLGQIWETVRQWILNSPYSKFGKVPRKLPTKISEGEFEWSANEAKDDIVKLSRVGDGMEIVSARFRKELKWRTVMTFTRQKKAVKCSVKVLIDGTTSEDSEQESKVPRIVKQLTKIYGLEALKAEKAGCGGGNKTPGSAPATKEDVEKIASKIAEEVKADNAKSRKKLEAKVKVPRPELTQEMVAKDFGVSRKTVNKWEANQTTDGPENKSNKFGYYKALRTNPDLRGAYDQLVQIVKVFNQEAQKAKKTGRRSITFVAFNEAYHSRMAKKAQ